MRKIVSNIPVGRRQLLRGAALTGSGAALVSAWPGWAAPASAGTTATIPELSGEDILLRIARQTVTVDGRGVGRDHRAALDASARSDQAGVLAHATVAVENYGGECLPGG